MMNVLGNIWGESNLRELKWHQKGMIHASPGGGEAKSLRRIPQVNRTRSGLCPLLSLSSSLSHSVFVHILIKTNED